MKKASILAQMPFFSPEEWPALQKAAKLRVRSQVKGGKGGKLAK